MPFEQTCPGCGANFQLPDKLAGKSLCCQECQYIFVGAPMPSSGEEEPVLADVVADKTPAPAKVALSPPVSKSKPRNRSTPPANKTSGFGWMTAVLGVVIVAFGMTCGVSVVLIAANFIPRPNPVPLANNEPIENKNDHEKDKDKDLKKDKNDPPASNRSARLPVDFEGNATVRANLNDGESSYRVELRAGGHYAAYVRSKRFGPNLQVRIGKDLVAERLGKSSSYVNFVANRDGEHTIIIHTRTAPSDGEFELQFGTVAIPKLSPINVTPPAGFSTKAELTVRDPALEKKTAPYRAYPFTVVPGKEYEFKVHSADFMATLQLKQRDDVLDEWFVDRDTGKIEGVYKADRPGEVVAYVSSDGDLGAFTFSARVLPDRPLQAGRRNVEFKENVFQHITLMDKEAPRDPKGVPFITYELPMEAGWGYSIDHKHATGDVMIVLYGPDGNILGVNNRFGNTRHARILHDAKVPGNYQLNASVAEPGPLSYTLEITRFKLPTPEIVDVRPPVKTNKGAGFTLMDVELVKGTIHTLSCAWSRDGTALFVFDEAGWLHRFRLGDFHEESKVFLDKETSNSLHVTAEGILVPRIKQREFWILDPVSLRILHRVPFLGAPPILAAPNLSVAFTQASGKIDEGQGKKKGIATYDLAGKNPVSGSLTDRLNQVLAITPDGKYVFAKTDDDRLGRWHIADKKLVFEQAGDLYGPAPFVSPLTVSADGKWLLRTITPVAGPRPETKSAPPSGFGVLAYSVNDLDRVAFMIDTGSTAYDVATDPRSGKIFTYSDARGLLMADPNGKVEEIPLPIVDKNKDRVRRILFHPVGNRFVAVVGGIGSGRVIYVELNNVAAPIVKAPQKPFLSKFEPEPVRVGDLSVQKIAWYIYWNTPCWSPDGKSFYIVQSQNIIYDVDARDFSIRNSNFFKPFTWVRGGACFSADGLLSLGCGDKMQGADMDLILMDPKTMQVIKRIRCPHSSLVASAPNLSVAFVGGKNIYTQSKNQADLLAVDLNTGVAVKPELEFPVSPLAFQVSPDGKYFYGTDGRSIARFRIAGTKLIHEETSKVIAKDEKTFPRLEISLDGTKVWLVGQSPPKDKDALGIHMLDALDFTKPARVLPERAYSANFDPLTKALVVARHDKVLEFLGADGQPVPLGGDWNCDPPRQIIMHPQGGEMFMIGNNTLYHVRWKK